MGVPRNALANWWVWTRGVRALAKKEPRLHVNSDLEDLVSDLMNFDVLREHSPGAYTALHKAMMSTLEGNDFPVDMSELLVWHLRDLRRAFRRPLRKQVMRRKY